MTRLRQASYTLLAVLALPVVAAAQESQLGSDIRREHAALESECASFSFRAIGSCAYTLFTDHPLHIAAGSLAPQNGFGLGLAFVTHWTPNESWRLSWDVDAVASPNASWRAGAYMTAIWNRRPKIVVRTGGAGSQPSNLVRESPVFHVLAQSISLNTLGYFGLGPGSTDTARSFFGMRQTIAGLNAAWPILARWNIALYGEAYGRFVDIRSSPGRTSPSIEQIYPFPAAPGLDRQPAFLQFGEGIRIAPSLAGGHIRLNYATTFKEYLAPGDSTFSFNRWNVDLLHEFPIYRTTRSTAPRAFNGPDECGTSSTNSSCPPVSRNREGSFSIRFLMNQSIASAGHVVPFYFQPTLGGSDIDGNLMLPSYQDYRFRAPNSILMRAAFEHSIWGPFGFSAMVDEGKVTFARSDLDFSHLLHSYAAGLTMRAGGFPMVQLMFSWGGHEGMHTIASMNTSLLGGAARPSLY